MNDEAKQALLKAIAILQKTAIELECPVSAHMKSSDGKFFQLGVAPIPGTPHVQFQSDDPAKDREMYEHVRQAQP
jgi:hypothetical protein